MKKIAASLILLATLFSCKENLTAPKQEKINYAVFGDSISVDGAISEARMLEKYQSLKEGDTVEVVFKSKIVDVCQKKGCWMNLALNEKESSFVKFKDYAFFVPLNAAEKEVVVKGKAFVSIESVDELKHYAKDAGKSQAAIDSITKPESTYGFMADGVLIKK
ncbi:DUF4920 domain-containing protein [Flavobacterium sp.]|jgi:hypothetical protein|uniref:DUF4920 domain-containing protein n=1 Tax=Flavobacterium sp. TaxID=239 RepID=UPI0037C1319F